MKKLLSVLLILSFLPSFSGCGSIYTNYREIEQLLVIQTMGLDYIPGGVRISLASAAGSGPESEPVCLSSAGVSITAAMERAQNYSNEDDLFFAHINTVILGEEAARQGIDNYLSFICRSPHIRIDMPLFIVKDTTAEELMSSAGRNQNRISEIMNTLYDNLERQGENCIFGANEVIRNFERYGSSLICAIEYADAAEIPSASENSGTAENGAKNQQAGNQRAGSSSGGESGQKSGGKTAAINGYGVLKAGRLLSYIDAEGAVGVGFLLNRVGVDEIIVEDQAGSKVTLEISQGGSQIRPLWAEDGSLHGLDVSAEVSASVADMEKSGNLDSPEYSDYITSRLEAAVSSRISAVLRLSQKLSADFLGLAGRIETQAPEKFRAMAESFEQCLPDLELRISVSGELSHSNDIKD